MNMKLRPVHDILFSLTSGLLLAASFPLLDWSFVAWFALVPLFLVMSKRPFLNGYVAGFSFFAAALYWLNIVMVTYGQLPWALSIIAYLLLVSYLAFYFALPIWLAERFRQRRAISPFITLPVLWVGFEFLRGILLTGFPWTLIGYSQHANLIFIQSADLVGVYGIGALILFANAVFANLIRAAWRLDFSLVSKRALIVFVLFFAVNCGYGVWRLGGDLDRIDSPLRVSLIQGNIEQSVKWDPAYQLSTINRYLSLSKNAVQDGAQLLIWPESATPFYLQDPSPLSQRVRQFVSQSGRHLLTGSPAYEYQPKGVRYLNSSFLLSPEGNLLGRSDKVHLVPFGEYVPLSRFLPFVNKLVTGIGDFSPGSVEPIKMPEGNLGILVCYEGIFPELARQYVKAGSGLLVNVTNDAWFGHSSAPYQHLSMARFRAIENRRWLVRAANTGVSAVIAPSGEIVSSSSLFQPDVVTENISFRSELSIYTLFGDIFPVVSLLLGIFWLALSRKKSNQANIIE